MFESSKQFRSKGKYSYNKRNSYSSYYKKGTGFSKKQKGILVELDENYTYQTSNRTLTDISNKESKTKHKDVTEFHIIDECEDNKENCSGNTNRNKIKMNDINIIEKKENSINSNSIYELIESEKKENNYIASNKSNVDNKNNTITKTQTKPFLSLSVDALNEAFYFPKKLSNVYNYLYTQYQIQRHFLNSNNQLYPHQQSNTISSSFNSTECNQCKSFYCNGTSSSNSLLNNSNSLLSLPNQNSYQSFLSNNLSRNSITPFTYYETPHKHIFTSKTNPNWNINDINISQRPMKEIENTEVLKVNIKISEKETLVFKIRRYDDMFKTVKIFCEINKLNSKFIRPIILYIIKALNTIYGVVNMSLTEEEIETITNIYRTTK